MSRAPAEPQELITVFGPRGIDVLRNLLLLVFVLGLLFVGVSWWSYGLRGSSLASLTVPGVALVSTVFLHCGRQRTAVYLLVWSLVGLALGLTFAVAGVRTPALFALPSLCIAAGWLLGMRAASQVALMTGLVVGGIVVAEQFGYVPPNELRNSGTFATVLISAMLMALLVTRAALRGFQEKIDRVTQLTQEQQFQLDALRLSEARVLALFRANPTPSSTVDADGCIQDVNDAWVTLFGVDTQQALNKTSYELGLWHDPDERKAVMAEFEVKGRLDGALVHLNTSTGVRPMLLYLSSVEFAGGQRRVSSLVDQTDRLVAEAAQRAIHEGLELRVAQRTAELSSALATVKATQSELVQAEKLASLGAMVAGISHELNTPVGITVTVASAMQQKAQEFAKLVDEGRLRKSELSDFLRDTGEMAGLILRSTQRAAELIDSFKEVAVDRTSERRRVFDLQVLVNEIVSTLQPILRKSPVTVTQDVPPGLICDSYPGPLGQVLTNLVLNAAKHAFGDRNAGHIAIAASVATDVEPSQIVLTVSDDGVGMSDHVKSHAFDPFFTTRLGQGGSGLGLSVSYRLASAKLGGALSLESRLGEGSCFSLRFTQVAAAAP